MRNAVRFQGVSFRIGASLERFGHVIFNPHSRYSRYSRWFRVCMVARRKSAPKNTIFLMVTLTGEGKAFFDFCRHRYFIGDRRGDMLLEIQGRVFHFHATLDRPEKIERAGTVYFHIPITVRIPEGPIFQTQMSMPPCPMTGKEKHRV